MKSGAIDDFTSEILSARASENKYISALVKSLNILYLWNLLMFSVDMFTTFCCHKGRLCHFDEKIIYESICISYICRTSEHLAEIIFIHTQTCGFTPFGCFTIYYPTTAAFFPSDLLFIYNHWVFSSWILLLLCFNSL